MIFVIHSQQKGCAFAPNSNLYSRAERGQMLVVISKKTVQVPDKHIAVQPNPKTQPLAQKTHDTEFQRSLFLLSDRS